MDICIIEAKDKQRAVGVQREMVLSDKNKDKGMN